MKIITTINSMLKKRIVQNSLWLFVLQFANTCLPLITIPYVTRVLGNAGYGDFSIAYNWITYCQVIVEYGFTHSGARRVALGQHEEISGIFKNIVSARASLYVFCMLGLNLLCLIFEIGSKMYLYIMLLSVIVFSAVFQMNWLFQGKQQMCFITIINVVARLFSVLLTFLFVKSAEHVAVYCICYSSTFLISSLLGLIVATKKFKIKLGIPSRLEVVGELKDGWHLFTSSAISRLFGGIGITVLGIYTGNDVVGGYSAVYKIPYIMTMCFLPISQALYPYISSEFSKNKNKALLKQRKLLVLVLGFFGVLGLGIMLLRDIIVRIVLGDIYVVYANLILFLIPQMLLGVLNNFLGVQSLVAGGYQKQYSHSVILSTLILVVFNFLLCPIGGCYGTAFSALVAEGLLTVFLIFNCNKLLWNVGE